MLFDLRCNYCCHLRSFRKRLTSNFCNSVTIQNAYILLQTNCLHPGDAKLFSIHKYSFLLLALRIGVHQCSNSKCYYLMISLFSQSSHACALSVRRCLATWLLPSNCLTTMLLNRINVDFDLNICVKVVTYVLFGLGFQSVTKVQQTSPSYFQSNASGPPVI